MLSLSRLEPQQSPGSSNALGGVRERRRESRKVELIAEPPHCPPALVLLQDSLLLE